MRYLFAVLSVVGLLNTSQAIAQDSPVVIELYTSQGCSSCPPADAILHDLAKRDDVIALALHVDYWDYIGWKDEFARPEYTNRQHGYAQAARARNVYTPQMVFNGKDHVVGSRAMSVMETLQAHQQQVNPVQVRLTRNGDRVRIDAETRTRGDYVVQVARYSPQETVNIRRGENAGRTLSYAHVVTSLEVISRWDGGAPLALDAAAAGDAPFVVLIQQIGFGPIVGAAELR